MICTEEWVFHSYSTFCDTLQWDSCIIELYIVLLLHTTTRIQKQALKKKNPDQNIIHIHRRLLKVTTNAQSSLLEQLQ